ncbi:AraC family transcriptional regulator [Leptospira sp. 201903070]|uniref:AraC family transcriptional regulator n=1 Tax=Leptospira ainlahdjerensis TaxID=2810033 RepID=A0ABS2UB58_9LEPT|nr:helix-turn-helix domain-containing protein [Leptospira ainlahdjerensis]MBM9577605.1 AraC family transcriptional regulator [Leptospira ainlahdjerensis]
MKPKNDKPRGVLKSEKEAENLIHARYLPGENLEFFIEHHWTVEWDLRRKKPQLAETLPHPSIHLVIDRGNSRIQGIIEGKFSYLLKDLGKVWGIKFKPGAFFPFYQKPVCSIRNRSIPIDSVFHVDVPYLENLILSAKNDEERLKTLEEILLQNLPQADENVLWIQEVIEYVLKNPDVHKVDDLASRLRIHKRTLQRQFSRYVGVSPKWVIQRYRLHEAAERLEKGKDVDGIQLALDLGYFDQAHFIKDFKTIVGKSPEQYSKLLMLKTDSFQSKKL